MNGHRTYLDPRPRPTGERILLPMKGHRTFSHPIHIKPKESADVAA